MEKKEYLTHLPLTKSRDSHSTAIGTKVNLNLTVIIKMLYQEGGTKAVSEFIVDIIQGWSKRHANDIDICYVTQKASEVSQAIAHKNIEQGTVLFNKKLIDFSKELNEFTGHELNFFDEANSLIKDKSNAQSLIEDLCVSSQARIIPSLQAKLEEDFPKFSLNIKLIGDPVIECGDYFKSEYPLFVGRECELTQLYHDLNQTKWQVVVGSPQVGKKYFTLAYVHSYGTKEVKIYPGGIFWFDFNRTSETAEASFKRFSLLCFGREIDIDNAIVRIKSIKEKLRKKEKTLFIFCGANRYEEIKEYLDLFQGDIDHHIIVVAYANRGWPDGKKLLKLENLKPDVGKNLISRKLGLEAKEDIERCRLISIKYEGHPGALAMISNEIKNKYGSSIKQFFENKRVENHKIDKKFKHIPNNEESGYSYLNNFIRSTMNVFSDFIKENKTKELINSLGAWCFFDNFFLKENFLKELGLTQELILILQNSFLITSKSSNNIQLYQMNYIARKTIKSIFKENHYDKNFPSLTAKGVQNQSIKNISLKIDLEKLFGIAQAILKKNLKKDFLLEGDFSFYEEEFIYFALKISKFAYQRKIFEKEMVEFLLVASYQLFIKGFFSDAEKIILQALNWAKSIYLPEETVIYYCIYGEVLKKLNRWRDSEEAFKEAITIYKNYDKKKIIFKPDDKIKANYALTLNFYASLINTMKKQNHEKVFYQYINESKNIKKGIFSEHHPEYAFALQTEGTFFYLKGNYKKALELYKKVFEILEKYYKVKFPIKEELDKHPFILQIKYYIGKTEYFFGKFKDAHQTLIEVEKVLNHTFPSGKNELLISTRLELAKINFWLGEYQQARNILENILDLEYYSKNNPHLNLVDAKYYLGRILISLGKINEGMELFFESYEYFILLYPNNSTLSTPEEKNKNKIILDNFYVNFNLGAYYKINNHESAKVIHYIAFGYYKKREYALAKAFYEEAIAINQSINSTNPKALLSKLGIASIDYQKGEFLEAKLKLENLLEKQRKAYGGGHFEIANTLRILAKANSKMEDYEKAMEHLNLALEMFQACTLESGVNIPEIALSKYAKAMLIMAHSNDEVSAETLLREALTQQKILYQTRETHAYIGQTLLGLALCQWRQGKYLEAFRYYQESEKILSECFSHDEKKHQSLMMEFYRYFSEFLYSCSRYTGNEGLCDFSEKNYLKAKKNQAFSNHESCTIFIRIGLSKIHVLKNELEMAEHYLKESEEIFQKFKANFNYAYPLILAQKAKIHQGKNLIKESIEFYKESINLLIPLIGASPALYLKRFLFELYCELSCTSQDKKVLFEAIEFFHTMYPVSYSEFIVHGLIEASVAILKNASHALSDNIHALSDMSLMLNTFLKVEKPDITYKIDETIGKIKHKLNQKLAFIISELNSEKLSLNLEVNEKELRKYIFVCCGSSEHAPISHQQSGRLLGQELIKNGFGLVYGGAKVGLMGILSRVVLENQGSVIGVTTPEINRLNVNNLQVPTLITTENYAERKRKMRELACAVIVLPGGLGTLDELAEVLISNQFAMYESSPNNPVQPICLYNAEGFFDGIIEQLQRSFKDGYFSEKHLSCLFFSDKFEEIFNFIKNFDKTFVSPNPERWWEKKELGKEKEDMGIKKQIHVNSQVSTINRQREREGLFIPQVEAEKSNSGLNKEETTFIDEKNSMKNF